MIVVAVFIAVLYALFCWYVCEDLLDLIQEELDAVEVAAGEPVGDANGGVRDPWVVSASLTTCQASVVGGDLNSDKAQA